MNSTDVANETILAFVACLARGEPIPFHLAVEYTIPTAWSKSDDPVALLSLASLTVSRPELIRAMTSIARLVTPALTIDVEACKRAIDLAARWAEHPGEGTLQAVSEMWDACASAFWNTDDFRNAEGAVLSVLEALHAVTADESLDAIHTEEGDGFVPCVLEVLEMTNEQLAYMLREHLPVVTLHDIIEAQDRLR